MKSRLFTILFLIFTASLFAQETNPADTLPKPAINDTLNPYADFYKPGLLPYNEDKKISVRMEMGTSFGVGSGGAGLYGVYAAPHVSYKVSPRLRVNFGAIIQNTNYLNYYNPYNPYYPEYTQTFNSNITRTLLYAEGQYLLNPRLMMSAKVYKEVAAFGEPQVNPRALDLDSEGVSVGFNYKINDNMYIGAEFSYGKGGRQYDPFMPMGSGMPYSNPYGINRNSIFDRQTGW